jgi:hypothetical protein
MFVVMSALIAGSVLGQPPELPPFIKERAKTTTFYYKSPDPTLGPKLLKELLKYENIGHRFFVDKEHVLNLIGAQFGDIAAGHPKLVREYEAEFAKAHPLGRRVIIRALMNCGDKETIAKVASWSQESAFSENKTDLDWLKAHLEAPKRVSVRDKAAVEPKDLDFLWVNFFITGEYAPISRILDVLDQPEKANNATLQRVARWSLNSNADQHPALVELLKKHVKDRPAASRKHIEQILNPVP